MGKFGLGEHLEDLREHLRCNAHAGVAHAEDDLPASGLDADRDLTTFVAILCGVVPVD